MRIMFCFLNFVTNFLDCDHLNGGSLLKSVAHICHQLNTSIKYMNYMLEVFLKSYILKFCGYFLYSYLVCK